MKIKQLKVTEISQIVKYDSDTWEIKIGNIWYSANAKEAAAIHQRIDEYTKRQYPV